MNINKLMREQLAYNPHTGILVWIVNRGGRVVAGKRAGFNMQHGYRYICFYGKYYLEHRVAWFLHTGRWPKHMLDHKDRNGFNNKWKNLREAKNAHNQMNKKKGSNNTSGYKGVCWHKRGKRWVAMIEKAGKQIWLGTFSTPKQAHQAYIIAAQKHFGEFARTR